MALQVICPNLRCRKIRDVTDADRGKLVNCKYCQTCFRVPNPQYAPTPALAASARGK